jgi:hypothetical protein
MQVHGGPIQPVVDLLAGLEHFECPSKCHAWSVRAVPAAVIGPSALTRSAA